MGNVPAAGQYGGSQGQLFQHQIHHFPHHYKKHRKKQQAKSGKCKLPIGWRSRCERDEVWCNYLIKRAYHQRCIERLFDGRAIPKLTKAERWRSIQHCHKQEKEHCSLLISLLRVSLLKYLKQRGKRHPKGLSKGKELIEVPDSKRWVAFTLAMLLVLGVIVFLCFCYAERKKSRKRSGAGGRNQSRKSKSSRLRNKSHKSSIKSKRAKSKASKASKSSGKSSRRSKSRRTSKSKRNSKNVGALLRNSKVLVVLQHL